MNSIKSGLVGWTTGLNVARFQKRNIFIVLSPFQLICAQEAREKFCQGETNFLVIIDRNGPGTLEYVQKAAELDEVWDKVVRFREPRQKGLKRFLTRLNNTCRLLVKMGFGKGKVFLGDPYLNWFRYIGGVYGDEVIWLDDGAASINVIAKFEDEGLLAAPNQTTPKFFTVFSSPDLEARSNGAVMQNEMLVKRATRRKKQTIVANTAIFIGQWHSEKLGTPFTAELNEFLRWIRDFDGWDVTYVAHRHESKDKLNEISKVMTVKSYETSIETAFLHSEELPQVIISWYSTALFTLNRLFPEIEVISFQIPLNDICSRQRAELMRVYGALDGQGVEIKGRLE